MTSEEYRNTANSAHNATKAAKRTHSKGRTQAPGADRAPQGKIRGETANRITANIIRAANLQTGCVAYRINNVGVWDAAKQVYRAGNTEKGLPDIIGCFRGRLVGIEVKAGKDKMSIHQEARKQEIERAGGVFLVVRETNDFLTWFQSFLT